MVVLGSALVFPALVPNTGSALMLNTGRTSVRLQALNEGIVNEVVKVGGEMVPTERFVEADVGMRFPKFDISERLYAANGPWPDDFPFSPEAFKRQDEDDDADFYSIPRLCYHIDEGAVRALTNYYKENIDSGSDILDIFGR